ncbi:MAG: lactate racemase domain-containing protein [Sphaerochaetaceae bacterium]|jgi:nickel-dependent lactate racemase|nr:lactate racemase domain-containing protein [Sphaerochaetaceae bacterium]MDY0371177.1 lactate racemase domain-containing protein [Sphaerochaetaceae bacterium]
MIYTRLQDSSGISLDAMKKQFFKGLKALGKRERVLLIPPDITRLHGLGGTLAVWAVEYYQEAVKAILPALGTHVPMTEAEINTMYPGLDHNLFVNHDWRNDIVTLGTIPASFIEEVSEGRLSYSWKAQVNKLLISGGFDLILSLGQVVPHEVVGMANHTKNIFIGTGGAEGINKSHYLGAVYGMERMMGRADSPVRAILDYAHTNFAADMPLVFALTVVGRNSNGEMVPKGLFLGDDRACFDEACELSLKVNFTMVEQPLKKVVVYLDPNEYRSTWLGNKSIYRTRMAIADGGELIVLAPGVHTFGEDEEIDRLIRKYGYCGTDAVLKAVTQNDDLKANLSAAAHLIHGSSEGRFSVRYCPGALTQQEVESVGYLYGDLAQAKAKYITDSTVEGLNTDAEGNSYYFISNPAVGLWAHPDRFENA